MTIKNCVGAVIYHGNEILLVKSPKWAEGTKFLIPGGKIEQGESEEGALHREIGEELGIQIHDLYKLSESVWQADVLGFYDPSVEFHFKTYAARASSDAVVPNKEITTYGWFNPRDALKFPITYSSRQAVYEFLDTYPTFAASRLPIGRIPRLK